MRPEAPNPTSRRVAMKSKDRKKWCGGKVGREHDYVVAYPPNMTYPAYRRCGVPSFLGMTRWMCSHRLICQTCGRQESLMDTGLCPVYQEKLADEARG